MTCLMSLLSGLSTDPNGARPTPEELMARWAREDAERKAQREAVKVASR